MKPYQHALLLLLAFIVAGSATVMGVNSIRAQQQADFEQDPGNENSTYIGNFASSIELRRIDDREKGTVCYYAGYREGLSCVYVGSYDE